MEAMQHRAGVYDGDKESDKQTVRYKLRRFEGEPLTYRLTDVLYAELPVKANDDDRALTWAGARSRLYQFETLVRDFSATSVELHGKDSSTEAQQAWALTSIRKPVIDSERSDRVYSEVRALAGAYVMPG